MYEILLWKLKLVSPIFIFAIKIQFLKNYLEGLFLPKNILLSSRLLNFCTSLFPSFFLSWPMLIL